MRVGASNGIRRAQMDSEDFMDFIKLFLRSVDVDEAWYLEHNPDVAEAIEQGAYRSPRSLCAEPPHESADRAEPAWCGHSLHHRPASRGVGRQRTTSR